MDIKIIQNDDIDKIISDISNSLENFNYEYISKNINDTLMLASYFAKHTKVGQIINLNGELGAGKTAFMTGFTKELNIEYQISSPTFTIVNEYNLENNNNIFHFDVYRIEDSSEFLDSIGTEYFQNGICIIEWGNIIKDILPKNTINIDIKKDENDINKRIFKIWREN